MSKKQEAKDLLIKATEDAKTLIKEASTTAKSLLETATKVATQSTNLDVIATDIKYIQEDVKEIKSKLETKYVSVESFIPVRNIVYGLVSVIGLAVLGAIARLVITP